MTSLDSYIIRRYSTHQLELKGLAQRFKVEHDLRYGQSAKESDIKSAIDAAAELMDIYELNTIYAKVWQQHAIGERRTFLLEYVFGGRSAESTWEWLFAVLTREALTEELQSTNQLIDQAIMSYDRGVSDDYNITMLRGRARALSSALGADY